MSGVITITWSESVENHARMQIIGKIAESGFKLSQLQECMKKFEELKSGCCELIALHDFIDEKVED